MTRYQPAHFALWRNNLPALLKLWRVVELSNPKRCGFEAVHHGEMNHARTLKCLFFAGEDV